MFFLSVGMLFDPKLALQSPALLFGTVAAVVLLKPLLTFGLVAALGYSSKTAIAAALALAQIGEFSFLLATLGRQLEILSDLAMNALVVASVLSIMVNPALYRAAGPAEKWLRGQRWLWRLANRPRAITGPDVAPPSGDPTAVVVGYGPTGQTVCRILRSRGIEPTVIEMNIDTYRRLRAEGQPAVYGDAGQSEVLAQAGIATASSLILSASGFAGATETVRLGRELNPAIHVVVRADYLSEISRLRAAGADEVVTGEGEVAVEITGSILRQLGATPDQLDEERDRLRASLRFS
jgi:CPA2 family monovalent cation:H+ antiporter-2